MNLSPRGVALLYTGGKDSTYAVQKLRESTYDVSCLVSVVSENEYSYMLHTPNIKETELSAQALGIPIVFGFTKGEKEKELVDIRETVREARKMYEFDFLGSGGLCSEYQKSRLGKIAEEVGLISLNPLWGLDQRTYMSHIIMAQYRFILTSVSCAGLDDTWLGKKIDNDSVTQLLRLSERFRFNPAFEGGEAETLVLDCPLFTRQRLEIVESEAKWDGTRGVLIIKKIRLVEKVSSRESSEIPAPQSV
jgi:diphthine-ammonia ligase